MRLSNRFFMPLTWLKGLGSCAHAAKRSVAVRHGSGPERAPCSSGTVAFWHVPRGGWRRSAPGFLEVEVKIKSRTHVLHAAWLIAGPGRYRGPPSGHPAPRAPLDQHCCCMWGRHTYSVSWRAVSRELYPRVLILQNLKSLDQRDFDDHKLLFTGLNTG